MTFLCGDAGVQNLDVRKLSVIKIDVTKTLALWPGSMLSRYDVHLEDPHTLPLWPRR